MFKLSNGSRIGFWLDPWIDMVPLKFCFPALFRIALNPNGSVLEHWDESSFSWSIFFHYLLKEEEIIDSQTLLGLVSRKRFSRVWIGMFGLY